MFNVDFARDLLLTGVIFGAAAFVWAGWAQERPPKGVVWRMLLVVLQSGGLLLAGFGVFGAVRNWDTPTTLTSGSPALVWYIVVFWLEVAAMIALAILFVRTKRSSLIAPMVLVIVGLHFVPLAFVFGQPIILLAGVLITGVGVIAAFLPREKAAPSFWCGLLSAPIFLVLGLIAFVAGSAALAA